MKKLIVAVVVLGITIFGMSGTAISQNKIGYINTEELIGSMPEAEKANAELQEYQSALQQPPKCIVGMMVRYTQAAQQYL